ncbi:MAG: hypothetical protein HY321_10290 [Armatimonadetes bacterium]|nr:hypothetical protein [Armatimonadota bacterium]
MPNINIRDADGAVKTIGTSEDAGQVHRPQHVLYSPDGLPLILSAAAAADGQANPVTALVRGAAQGFNGPHETDDPPGTWDRWRNNTEAVLLPGGTPRSQNANHEPHFMSDWQINYNGRGVIVSLNLSQDPPEGAAGVKVFIYGRDVACNAVINLLVATTAVSAKNRYVYVVYPGAAVPAAGHVVQASSLPVGRQWRVEVLHMDDKSYVYSVAGMTCL